MEFANAAAKRAVDLSSQAEVVEAYLAIKATSALEHLQSKQIKALLEEFAWLVSVDAGRRIHRPESPTQAFFVVNGWVTLTPEHGSRQSHSAESGKCLELKTLFDGEAAWKYSWTAESHCQFLVIDFAALREAWNANAKSYAYLDRTVRWQVLERLASELKLLGFARRQIVNTVASLKPIPPVDFKSEEWSTGVLLVVGSGEVHLSTRTKGQNSRTLRGGSYGFIQVKAGRKCDPGGLISGWALSEAEWTDLIGAEQVAKTRLVIDAYQELEVVVADALPTTVAPEEADPTIDDDPPLELFLAKSAPRRRRRPVAIRQYDQMDCGAACCAMVSKYYGRNIDIPTFRAHVAVTRDGATALALKRGLDKVGFRSTGVSARLDYLKECLLPCICLMQYHWVVLYKITDTELIIADPMVGIRYVTPEQFNEEYARTALLLRPTERLAEYPETRRSYWEYRKLLRGHHLDLAVIAYFALIGFLFGAIMPLFDRYVYDGVILGGQGHVIGVVVAAYFGVQLVSSAMSFASAYLTSQSAARLELKFGALFLRQLTRLPLPYFAVRNVGDFTTRMGELNRVQNYMTSKPLSIPFTLLSLVIYGAALALFCAPLLAICAAVLPLNLLFAKLIIPKTTSLMDEIFIVASKSGSMVFEQIKALPTLRALRAGIPARWRWQSLEIKQNRLQMKQQRLGMITTTVTTFMNAGINNALFGYAIYRFFHNQMSLGQVIAATSFAHQLIPPLVSLTSEWRQVKEVSRSFARLDDIFTAETEGSATPAQNGPTLAGKIELRNVSFRYGNELSPWVVRNVSLVIEAGETVAFVGRSGSGKSTLGLLLNMLYQPVSGEILYDDRPAATLGLENVRAQVVMIMQEPAVFSRSIIENIALGDSVPDFRRVVDAATRASAHEFIIGMKHAYSTVLGESGAGLSGGQRQRLGIARALYRDGPILIMDEATSALDGLTEKAVVQNLRARERKLTTVIIAHRLNTITHADRIIVLDQGKILEMGSHRQLMERRGAYCALFRRQLQS